MVMHRYCLARRRHADLENANEFVLKNDLMSGRSGLDGIVAVGELRFFLSVEIEVSCEKDKKTNRESNRNVTLSEVPQAL
jgi:hypothetical protein